MKKFALVGMLLSASCAHAADWKLIGKNETSEVYIDKQSVSRSGVHRKAWLVYSHAEGKKVNGKIYKSSKSLDFFSCRERTISPSKTVFYELDLGNGDVIEMITTPLKLMQFSDVTPDTFGEAALNFVCQASLPSV